MLLGDPLLALAPELTHDLPTDADALASLLRADVQAARGHLLSGINLAGLDELADLFANWRSQWGERIARGLQIQIDQAAARGKWNWPSLWPGAGWMTTPAPNRHIAA